MLILLVSLIIPGVQADLAIFRPLENSPFTVPNPVYLEPTLYRSISNDLAVPANVQAQAYTCLLPCSISQHQPQLSYDHTLIENSHRLFLDHELQSMTDMALNRINLTASSEILSFHYGKIFQTSCRFISYTKSWTQRHWSILYTIQGKFQNLAQILKQSDRCRAISPRLSHFIFGMSLTVKELVTSCRWNIYRHFMSKHDWMALYNSRIDPNHFVVQRESGILIISWLIQTFQIKLDTSCASLIAKNSGLYQVANKSMTYLYSTVSFVTFVPSQQYFSREIVENLLLDYLLVIYNQFWSTLDVISQIYISCLGSNSIPVGYKISSPERFKALSIGGGLLSENELSLSIRKSDIFNTVDLAKFVHLTDLESLNSQ